MKSLFLNKNISSRVESGHPWIFANEVNRGKALDAAAKAGEIVNVFTHDKKFIGKGQPYSSLSLIDQWKRMQWRAGPPPSLPVEYSFEKNRFV